MDASQSETGFASTTPAQHPTIYLIGGIVMRRRFEMCLNDIAETEVCDLAKLVRALSSAIKSAVKATGEAGLSADLAIRVRQVELILTKEIGVAILLEQRGKIVSSESLRKLVESLQDKWYGIIQSALRLRNVNDEQGSLLEGTKDVTNEAKAFSAVFNQKFRAAVDLVVLDAQNIEARHEIHIAAAEKSRRAYRNEPSLTMKGVVSGFLAGRNVFNFEGQRGQGTLEVEVAKPQLFLPQLSLLHLSLQPCLLALGVASLVEKTSVVKLKHTLISIDAVLEHDWQGTLGMLKSAADQLASKSMPAGKWQMREPPGKGPKSMPESAADGNGKQEAVHGLSATDGAGVGLADQDRDASAAGVARTPRRRKEGDPF